MEISSNDSKVDIYEKVIQIHFEKGPVEHNYTFGFLCELFSDVLTVLESNAVLYTHGPVNICGDLRSRYGDLLEIFKKSGWPCDTKYIFLGNLTNGANLTIETLVLLFCCKICYSEKFLIIRGFLENAILSYEKSFIGELRVKYPDGEQWQYLTDMVKNIYRRLPLCVVLNKKIICVNSNFAITTAMPSDGNTVVTVKNGSPLGDRKTNIEIKFLEIDEPKSVTSKLKDEAAKGVKTQLQEIDMSLIIDSNFVCKSGYQFSLQHQVLTLTSGSKLAENVNNRGVVMMMDEHNNVRFKVIGGTDADELQEKNVFLR